MSDLNTQLKALEAIHDTPSVPDILPMVSDFDGEGIVIPKVIEEYLTKTGQMPELNDEGKISMDEYCDLMNNSGIPKQSWQIWGTRYTVITPEQDKEIRNGKR